MQTESQSIDQIYKVPQPAQLEKPVRITEQPWPEGTVPVVSIRCITYNHVNFIRDAIEGFLMQETTFPVEILIHDDASTDGTADIVREYQAKYPQLIRTVLQTENQWSKGREASRRARKPFNDMARGAFIAFCEGDDYWTDPSKLQKQIAILRANPQASGSFHAVSMLNKNGDILEVRPSRPVPSRLTFCDVVVRNYLFTCSLVYRSSAAPAWSPWSARLPMGDWPLQVNLARSGDLLGIDEDMGCYRRHLGGVWTRMSKREELNAISDFYSAVYKAFKGSLPKEFYRRYTDHYWECFKVSLNEQGLVRACRECFFYLWTRLKYFFSFATASL
jgi:glycosyltransferase involved in cell wall biosynthesis